MNIISDSLWHGHKYLLDIPLKIPYTFTKLLYPIITIEIADETLFGNSLKKDHIPTGSPKRRSLPHIRPSKDGI